MAAKSNSKHLSLIKLQSNDKGIFLPHVVFDKHKPYSGTKNTTRHQIK
jgi:hypothetical protein